MAVVRWNPWNDVFDLHAQMDHLFQPAAATTSRSGVEYATLPVDIRQTDAAFIVDASVPGFTPDDVEVTFDDGVLTITGRRSAPTPPRTRPMFVASAARRRSSARSDFPPKCARRTSPRRSRTALLRIEIPRTQKAAPQRIPVTAGATAQTVVEHAPSA